ncbi:hypothetical protein SAMN05428989_0629 [Pseudoxanthomonas sp. GM95]|uniref:hypothetical protein n=1 Tax=Pseudoxanthomonas sp. GM95 TaxID=1881043 RepID=UPI0008AD9AF0|nr:hypothetical protein [Pseudoxanthomonas sp. GM95]SEK70070.1 hypothetical protein SAMN05428989_0629 [Pseudoxanthomonas sp. GM95]
MNKYFSVFQRTPKARHGVFVPVLIGVCLSFVASPAMADWQVDDDKTQEAIKNLREDVNSRLDKIYDQHNLNGAIFDVDKYKSKSLQYGNGSSGTQDGKLDSFSVDEFVSVRCGKSSSTSAAAGEDPTEQSVCKDIVEHQNRLYNYLLDMLALIKDRQSQLKEIIDERRDITKNADASKRQAGALESNTNQLLALQTQLQIDRMNMDLTASSYQRYFDARNAQLADIQRVNLNGAEKAGIKDYAVAYASSVARNKLIVENALKLARKWSD